MENNIKKNIKIIFFGTSEFGIPSLEYLIKDGWQIIAVVANPDRPIGRKQEIASPPLKKFAIENNLPIFQPEKVNSEDSYKKIAELKPDLAIVAAYGQIIRKKILDIPKFGFLNLHGSLLPAWRGASPAQYAILNGDKETGVTLMKINEKMDEGPIIYQEKTVIEPNEIFETLYKKLSDLSVKVLEKSLIKYLNNKIIPKEQNQSLATYTKLLTKEDGRIFWNQNTTTIERKIRALNPWPGTYTMIENFDGIALPIQIKIIKASIVKCENKNDYGKPIKINNDLAIKAADDCLLIEILQLLGKRKMTSKEFLNGNPDILNKKFI